MRQYRVLPVLPNRERRLEGDVTDDLDLLERGFAIKATKLFSFQGDWSSARQVTTVPLPEQAVPMNAVSPVLRPDEDPEENDGILRARAAGPRRSSAASLPKRLIEDVANEGGY